MNDCLAQLQACALRVSRLEANGVPDPGANNLYTSDAMSLASWDPEIEAGQEFTAKNACGALLLSYKEPDQIKRLNFALGLVTPDPELHELLVANSKILTVGDAVGFAYPPLNVADAGNGVSIELWTKRVDSSGELDTDFPYAWWVFPRVRFVLGQKQAQNGPMENPFTGQASENPNWFDGPLNDWPTDSDRVAQWIPTDELPEPSCGYQTLVAS